MSSKIIYSQKTFPIAEGLTCPGCGGPMKHNNNGHAWCAVAPGFCKLKNHRIPFTVDK